MHKQKYIFATLLLLGSMVANGQEKEAVDLTPKVHGTIRGKYEYQSEDKEGRFEVRTARISLSGKVASWVNYKAEIDLSDEGKIKMLDAYTQFTPITNLNFTLGQMRVPFTIDAHRSPHLQYFANRSFIAKQVGNVRDVGATLGYTLNCGFPIRLEAGIFNGSGLTNQKDFWTNNINYSTKAQFFFPRGFNLTLSAQKIKPDQISVMMYDAGVYYHAHGWHAEVEYLYKHYADNAFDEVHALDAFVNYDIPLRNKFFTKVSPLLRYDYMSDHSDGIRYVGNEQNEAGKLKITDYQRSRLTGGVTLSIDKPFVSDIRLNYEKYFYANSGIPKTSEHDKFVIEIMTRF